MMCDSGGLGVEPSKRSEYEEEEEEEEDDDEDDDDLCCDGYDEDLNAADAVEPYASSPTFGSINVIKSSDIRIITKNFIKGPVTIKQIVNPSNELTTDSQPSAVAAVHHESGHHLTTICANGHSTVEQQPSAVKADQNMTPNEKSWLNVRRHKRTLGFIFGSVIVIGVTIVGATLIYMQRKDFQPFGDDLLEEDSPYQGGPTPIPSVGLKILDRNSWLAQPPTRPLDALSLPVPYVIVSHTATESCLENTRCILIIRTIQVLHVESHGWWDIGYNFIIGGNGYVYTGRGWRSQGAHTLGWNRLSLGVALVGTFDAEAPTKAQMTALQQLIDFGVRQGYVGRAYGLLATKMVSDTRSPGEEVVKIIKEWPHYVKDIQRLLKEHKNATGKG